MGRAAKPTALKVIEGNPGKRKLGDTYEPDPAFLNDLSAPAWLPEYVKKVWNEVAPKLRACRTLTELDVPALEAGCVAIANYRDITLKLGDNYTSKSSKGGTNINQLMIAQSMAFKQMNLLFAQFGMTPSARTKISLPLQPGLFDGKDESNGQQEKGAQYFQR